MFKKFFTATVMAATMAIMPAAAQNDGTINFTYDTSGEAQQKWGTAALDNYDVAIRLIDKGMVGSKVRGVIVDMLGTPYLANPSAFMTKELKLAVIDGKKQNVPDICQVEAEFNDKGQLVATFAEPYTITEDGVYVGFSFAVNELNDETKFPLVVGTGTNPNGLFIHTSRKFLKWVSKSEELDRVSSMRVVLEGAYTPYSVGINRLTESYFRTDETPMLETRLVNYGSNEAKTISYEYTIGDDPQVYTVKDFELTPALGNAYGTTETYMLPLHKIKELGTYTTSLKITEVNGEANVCSTDAGQTTFTIMAFVPKRRPLLKEYTGLWCGWCPLGYVSMKVMNELHPKDFVALSFHYNDEMMVSAELSTVSGYPYAELDGASTHVYMGNTNVAFGFEQTWKEACNVSTLCDIDVEGEWANEEHTAIIARAKTRFVRDFNDVDYRVAFALVGNGMSKPGWQQSNYLTGDTGKSYIAPDTKEELEVFINGKKYVEGLVFDDVCVAFPYPQGIQNSIPANIVTGHEYVTEYTFDLNNVKNYAGASLIQDKEKLTIVGVVVADNGKVILNSNKTCEMGTDGIASTFVEGNVVAVEYYDLTGRRVVNPEHGIYVKVETLDNGRRNTSKVAF